MPIARGAHTYTEKQIDNIIDRQKENKIDRNTERNAYMKMDRHKAIYNVC
jgi:hypothetical protein